MTSVYYTKGNDYANDDDYAKSPQDVMSDLQFLNKYSVFDWNLGRRETWGETVTRVMDYFQEVVGDKVSASVLAEVEKAIFNKEITPSMRLMATAGKGARKNQLSIYNCSYLPLQSAQDLHNLAMLLGHGVGVGFSVEAKFVSRWPGLDTTYKGVYDFVVPDDIEGWAKSFEALIDNYYMGYQTNFDYSLIRPSGAPLKTRGGHASGPEPLRVAHENIEEVLNNRAGMGLRSVDLLDIACYVADCIVSGGVRRSAMIAIFDKNDELMLNAKSGAWWHNNGQRALANISQVITDEMDENEWMDYLKLMDKNKSGEPGIWSRYAISHSLPTRRKYVDDFGPNPCFLEGTIVQTVDGPKPIEEITEPTFVYSMDSNGRLVVKPSTRSWKTREDAATVRIKVSSGSELCVTPEHKIFVVGRGWVEAKDLKFGDVVSHFRRGRRGVRYAGVRLSTQGESEEVMEHRLVWDGVFGSLHSGLDVHHVDNDGYNNAITNLCAMTHSSHSTFTRFSVPNDHQLFDENGKFASGSDGYKKEIVPVPDDKKVMLGFYGLKAGPYVVSVEEGPVGDVYDLNVEDTHCLIANNIVAHNCVEQILRPRQFCNLNQVIARENDTLESLDRKMRLAALVGTMQSAMTDFHSISDSFGDNCKEERLLGVSISGIMDCPLIASGDEKILNHLRSVVISENKKWAKKLGINQSTSTTCVKPDGNTSVFYNTSPGVHGRYAPFYIRRLQIQANSPVAAFAQAVGIPNELQIGNDKTLILSFPIKSPSKAIIQRERGAVEQLDNWLRFKKNFTETNPSVTVMYRPEELPAMASWLYANQKDVVGLSFLPADDHTYQQTPYEEIGEDEYNRLVSEFPKVNIDDFWMYESPDDTTQGAKNMACAGGACLI